MYYFDKLKEIQIRTDIDTDMIEDDFLASLLEGLTRMQEQQGCLVAGAEDDDNYYLFGNDYGINKKYFTK